MGIWIPGKSVYFRKKSLFDDLAESSWMGLLLYGLTGREFSEVQIKLFEAMWVITTSYPDPRLWNNRVAALAASNRSTAHLAIGAAIAVSEATIYGGKPNYWSIDFLLRCKQRLDNGEKLLNIIQQELKQYRAIAGYGRPLVKEDERIEPLLKRANELGLADGEYVKLAFAIEEVLLSGRWRMKMNIAALNAALSADQGLSTQQYYLYLTLSFTAGMFPVYIDALEKPEGCFFPLRCERINYTGKAPRTWLGNNKDEQ
jgi:hypothetical protein